MRTPLVLVALLGMTALADAVVLCARPRADGTFSSSVRIREVCAGREMPLDPVALGLQGPAGPKGDPGPQGLVGATGDPARYFTVQGNASPCSEGYTCSIVTLPLPAGAYVVTASGRISKGGTTLSGGCELSVEDGVGGAIRGDSYYPPYGEIGEHVTLTVVHNLPDGGVARVTCGGQAGMSARIVAVLVADLTQAASPAP